MKTSTKSLMLTAAMTGLLSGTAAKLSATPVPAAAGVTAKVTGAALQPGKTSFSKVSFAAEGDKHSCKGKNDCKGQGGCKASDNGCKGKNSCKGKGGCATDGSKPEAV